MLVALGANLLIAAAKAVGGIAAASPALLSEAAHSVADNARTVPEADQIFLGITDAATRAQARRPGHGGGPAATGDHGGA